jgi:hypothetical protein
MKLPINGILLPIGVTTFIPVLFVTSTIRPNESDIEIKGTSGKFIEKNIDRGILSGTVPATVDSTVTIRRRYINLLYNICYSY